MCGSVREMATRMRANLKEAKAERRAYLHVVVSHLDVLGVGAEVLLGGHRDEAQRVLVAESLVRPVVQRAHRLHGRDAVRRDQYAADLERAARFGHELLYAVVARVRGAAGEAVWVRRGRVAAAAQTDERRRRMRATDGTGLLRAVRGVVLWGLFIGFNFGR